MVNKTLLFSMLFFIIGCAKEEPKIQYGKNTFTTVVDGIERNYIVSVPKGYNEETNVPVVFMLHGTGGDGNNVYNTSGWKEIGEQENILTVFPSGLVQCNIDDGVKSVSSKWNSQPTDNWSYCQNVTPPDDVKYFGKIIDELMVKYSIDSKRIYFVGFSNGGQMCAKLSIFLSDRIAAIVECSGSFNIDSILSWKPVRKLPITYQLGNKEGSFEVPLNQFQMILNTPGFKPYIVQKTHVRLFDLNPNYTISGDTNSVVLAEFIPIDGNVKNKFNFVFVNGLNHEYPNGLNHWMVGAQVHWNWLKQFTLP